MPTRMAGLYRTSYDCEVLSGGTVAGSIHMGSSGCGWKNDAVYVRWLAKPALVRARKEQPR